MADDEWAGRALALVRSVAWRYASAVAMKLWRDETATGPAQRAIPTRKTGGFPWLFAAGRYLPSSASAASTIFGAVKPCFT